MSASAAFDWLGKSERARDARHDERHAPSRPVRCERQDGRWMLAVARSAPLAALHGEVATGRGLSLVPPVRTLPARSLDR